MDGTKRLFIAAGALGFVLVAGMGAWSLTGHRTAGVPVIEADSRPLRTKPDNPGGMTAIGANEQIMSGSSAGDVGDLAPPAEKPDPQALRAQKQAMVAPADPAPSPATPMPVTPMLVTPVAAPGSNLTPVPEPPAAAQAATSAPARPAAPRSDTPRLAETGTMVQIAAVESEQGASAEWQRLAKKMPDLLGDRRPVMQRAEHDGKAVWRVRTGGFADVAEATQFCLRLRAKGAGCSIANF